MIEQRSWDLSEILVGLQNYALIGLWKGIIARYWIIQTFDCGILEYMMEVCLTDIGDGLNNYRLDGDKIIRWIKFEILDFKQIFWKVP